jgi:hypothetical protein
LEAKAALCALLGKDVNTRSVTLKIQGHNCPPLLRSSISTFNYIILGSVFSVKIAVGRIQEIGCTMKNMKFATVRSHSHCASIACLTQSLRLACPASYLCAMSTFEPSIIIAILKNAAAPADKKHFETNWNESVSLINRSYERHKTYICILTRLRNG